MNREQKRAVIAEIAAQIDQSHAIFAVDYRGISVPQVAELRARLRDADATFRVVKNSLTERAADQSGAEPLKPLLTGPTALTFVRGDVATAAKAIADYGRASQLRRRSSPSLRLARTRPPRRATRPPSPSSRRPRPARRLRAPRAQQKRTQRAPRRRKRTTTTRRVRLPRRRRMAPTGSPPRR